MSEKLFNQKLASAEHWNEPLIVPFTPGEVLVRLSQVRGALSHAMPLALQDFSPRLQYARAALTDALESRERAAVATAFQNAQALLAELFEAAQNDEAALAAFGWPSPAHSADPFFIAVPDEKSVVASFALNGKQVLTSLAFDRVPGATYYWLHVVRYWEEGGQTQRVDDPILESAAPFFARVRLPVGTQILRLKARNTSTWALSPEFSIEVPAL